MSVVALPPAGFEEVLAIKTVREPASRARFASAMREYGRDGAEFTLERLRQLMLIEEQFHFLVLHDQVDFLRQPFAVSQSDRDFAVDIRRICLEAANGFQRYLRNRNAWATSRETRDVMFRVAGLAMNAIHGFAKWGHFLNEPARATPWKQVHALHALAEAEGYSQVPFVLHPAQPGFAPSVQSLYLRTLILDLLNSGNLTKVQIEIADGWFSSWCSDYRLDAEFSTRHHMFYVDQAGDAGLLPVRNDSQGDSLRYVRIDGLKGQIEEVQAQLRQGRLYAGHGAGAAFPVEEHIALLAIIEKLYHSILAGSQNRIEERTQFSDHEVDVVVGVERVMRKMRETGALPPGGDPVQPQPPPDPEIERWRVQDLSSRGYGLIVDRGIADAVLLNGLIALRNHQTGGWIAGSVVRKLSNRVRGEMLVGVEVLGYQPIPIDLVAVVGGAEVRALYLPGLDTQGKLDSIIVGAGDFTAGSLFAIRASGSQYRIGLNRVIKKGADWIKARFEIDSKA